MNRIRILLTQVITFGSALSAASNEGHEGVVRLIKIIWLDLNVWSSKTVFLPMPSLGSNIRRQHKLLVRSLAQLNRDVENLNIELPNAKRISGMRGIRARFGFQVFQRYVDRLLPSDADTTPGSKM